jgi:hypothetical protein
MSSKWMNRMHALVPMTGQEEKVEGVLLQYGITHLTHAVFPVGDRNYVTDFYLPNDRTIIECWQSSSRRGIALTWVEKNAAYVEWKFKRIKATYPDTRAVALVEVGQADPSLVRKYAGPVLEHADTLCCSMDELALVLREQCGVR